MSITEYHIFSMWLIIQLLQHDLQWSLWSRHCNCITERKACICNKTCLCLCPIWRYSSTLLQGYLECPAHFQISSLKHLIWPQWIDLIHSAYPNPSGFSIGLSLAERNYQHHPHQSSCGTSKDMGAYQAKPSVLKKTWKNTKVCS